MQKRYRTLIINPKSTSTIINIFHNEMCIFKQTIHHETTFKDKISEIDEEVQIRKNEILSLLTDAGINISKLDAIAANGGLLRPVEGGTYKVTKDMLIDLKNNYNGKHASNLGGIIAYEIAKGLNICAYIVDPPVVDELSPIAKISGLPSIERKSIFHALNQKAVARQAAMELDVTYETANLIVAHLGNGITIGAHKQGKVIDVNNGLHGDGPFSLERAGTIPSEALIDLCFSNQYTEDELIHEITYKGGIKGYLNIDNLEDIEQKIQNKDEVAMEVFHAMAYQIAKEIGSMASVLKGSVNGVVLTGELSKSKRLTNLITKRVNWIADVFIYPGEYDAQALNAGTLRVLRKLESAKLYSREISRLKEN